MPVQAGPSDPLPLPCPMQFPPPAIHSAISGLPTLTRSAPHGSVTAQPHLWTVLPGDQPSACEPPGRPGVRAILPSCPLSSQVIPSGAGGVERGTWDGPGLDFRPPSSHRDTGCRLTGKDLPPRDLLAEDTVLGYQAPLSSPAPRDQGRHGPRSGHPASFPSGTPGGFCCGDQGG